MDRLLLGRAGRLRPIGRQLGPPDASTSATWRGAGLVVGPGLDVEPQQRLGVGRPQVVPPVAVVHGQAVEPVDGAARRPPRGRPPPRRRPPGSATSVLISPESA